ncbi:DUF397 domain-containing protein [Streptomyces sp. SID8354]|nr:DUF397 domain-containing protein [Streptomyces sp. SID8354]
MRHVGCATDIAGAQWVKSSYSVANESQCVQVADLRVTLGRIAVRDSKDAGGPALTFSADGWSPFVSAVRRGEFPSG